MSTLIEARRAMKILDATCGQRLMWFDKSYPDAVYIDIRPEVKPTIICDSAMLPFRDRCFDMVVFDPPHVRVGPNSAMAVRYGVFHHWEIRRLVYEGFREFDRVLVDGGIVLFKWNDHSIKLSKILALIPSCFTPLFGQKVSIRTKFTSMTSWVCLIKKGKLL